MRGKPRSDSTNEICNALDQRIQCYKRKNYNLTFKAKALGWFIQLAIRLDLESALQELNDPANEERELLEYAQISEHTNDLKRLIREKHVLDEADLAELGLTLYAFPSLSKFYTDPKTHSFVRQARISEIKEMQDAVDNHERQLNTRWKIAFTRFNNIAPIDDSDDDDNDQLDLDKYTPSQIKSAVEVVSEDLLDELLLVVDLCAPTPILVKQFSEFIEKIKTSKDVNKDPYYYWSLYGVLPYIDLCSWMSSNANIRVKKEVTAELVLPQRNDGKFGSKTIDSITSAGAKGLFDRKGELFAALKEAASREFSAVVSFALGNCEDVGGDMANEAFSRWFPKTYPLGFSGLMEIGRLIPDCMDSIKGMIGIFAGEGALELDIAERIRKYTPDENASLNALFSLGKSMEA